MQWEVEHGCLLSSSLFNKLILLFNRERPRASSWPLHLTCVQSLVSGQETFRVGEREKNWKEVLIGENTPPLSDHVWHHFPKTRLSMYSLHLLRRYFTFYMQSSGAYCSLTHLSLLHFSPVKTAHNFQDAHLDRKLAVFFQQLIQRLMRCAVFWCAAMRHFSCCCLTYGEQRLKYLPTSQRWKWNWRGCAVVHIPFNGIDRFAFLFVNSILVVFMWFPQEMELLLQRDDLKDILSHQEPRQHLVVSHSVGYQTHHNHDWTFVDFHSVVPNWLSWGT